MTAEKTAGCLLVMACGGAGPQALSKVSSSRMTIPRRSSQEHANKAFFPCPRFSSYVSISPVVNPDSFAIRNRAGIIYVQYRAEHYSTMCST